MLSSNGNACVTGIGGGGTKAAGKSGSGTPTAAGNAATVQVSPHVYDSANDPHLKWMRDAFRSTVGSNAKPDETVELHLWYLICENSGGSCGEGFLDALRRMQGGEIGAPTEGDKLVGQGAAILITGSGDPFWIDPKRLVFAQKNINRAEAFSKDGKFANQTVNDVASKLVSGELTPEDVPVEVVVRGGDPVILNTRSTIALVRAGVSPDNWSYKNVTNDQEALDRYAAQLDRNKLGPEGYDGLVTESDWGSVGGGVDGDFVAP